MHFARTRLMIWKCFTSFTQIAHCRIALSTATPKRYTLVRIALLYKQHKHHHDRDERYAENISQSAGNANLIYYLSSLHSIRHQHQTSRGWTKGDGVKNDSKAASVPDPPFCNQTRYMMMARCRPLQFAIMPSRTYTFVISHPFAAVWKSHRRGWLFDWFPLNVGPVRADDIKMRTVANVKVSEFVTLVDRWEQVIQRAQEITQLGAIRMVRKMSLDI